MTSRWRSPVPVDGGGVLAGGDGLIEPAHLTQGDAEGGQRDQVLQVVGFRPRPSTASWPLRSTCSSRTVGSTSKEHSSRRVALHDDG
jgi:hypothetical protein